MLATTDKRDRSIRNVVAVYRHGLGKNQQYVEKENERYRKISKRYEENTVVGKFLNDNRTWISYVLSPCYSLWWECTIRRKNVYMDVSLNS